MRSIKVPIVRRQLNIPTSKIRKTFLVHGANWYTQVSIDLRIAQVKYLAFEIAQHPRVDWVLCQVLRRSLSIRITNLQIVKVAEAASCPLLCVFEYGCILCLARCRQVANYGIIDGIAVGFALKSDIKRTRRVLLLLN